MIGMLVIISSRSRPLMVVELVWLTREGAFSAEVLALRLVSKSLGWLMKVRTAIPVAARSLMGI